MPPNTRTDESRAAAQPLQLRCLKFLQTGENTVKLSKSEIARDLLQQGMLANERGDFSTAIITLSQSIQLMVQPSAYYHRGCAYRQNKKLHDALADLNMAIQLNPDSVDPYLQRAGVYSDLEDLARALKDLDKAVQIDEDNVQAYTIRGGVFYRMGEHEEALLDFDRAIDIDPRAFYAYHDRGLVRSAMHDYRAAIRDYSRAISIDPSHAFPYMNRALALSRTGDYVSAIADLNKALQRGRNPAEIAIIHRRHKNYRDKLDLAANHGNS
jgi:tetratricopeptide (TPR) repeat protein